MSKKNLVVVTINSDSLSNDQIKKLKKEFKKEFKKCFSKKTKVAIVGLGLDEKLSIQAVTA
jgi:hypothetical protein